MTVWMDKAIGRRAGRWTGGPSAVVPWMARNGCALTPVEPLWRLKSALLLQSLSAVHGLRDIRTSCAAFCGETKVSPRMKYRIKISIKHPENEKKKIGFFEDTHLRFQILNKLHIKLTALRKLVDFFIHK